MFTKSELMSLQDKCQRVIAHALTQKVVITPALTESVLELEKICHILRREIINMIAEEEKIKALSVDEQANFVEASWQSVGQLALDFATGALAEKVNKQSKEAFVARAQIRDIVAEWKAKKGESK